MPMDPETQRLDTYDDVMKEALRMARPSRTPWVLFGLALVAGAAVALWLLYRLDRALSDTAAANSAAQDARAQVDQARSDRVGLEMRAEKAEAEKAAQEAELAKLRGEMGELQDKMKAEIEKGDVRLSEAGGKIKVDVVNEILFDVGEASVSKQGEQVLARVGAVLAKMEDKQIQVSGHTDDSPISVRLKDRYPTNWELSSARAITVVRFLQDRAGVPGRRLVAAAHSMYEPLAPNKTEQGRARNRRIEILLTPDLEANRSAEKAAPVVAAPSQAPAKPVPAKATAPAKTTAKAPARKTRAR
jgi:chemotaxis protein MotB